MHKLCPVVCNVYEQQALHIYASVHLVYLIYLYTYIATTAIVLNILYIKMS